MVGNFIGGFLSGGFGCNGDQFGVPPGGGQGEPDPRGPAPWTHPDLVEGYQKKNFEKECGNTSNVYYCTLCVSKLCDGADESCFIYGEWASGCHIKKR
jgi:hypothetical protein